MKPRQIVPNVYLIGAVDWDRRLFDALIPLPRGTSYNAYLVQGGEKTALIDTVDPPKWAELAAQLDELPAPDYVVVHHVEQDHSGSLPMLLERCPGITVVCSEKARTMLVDHLHVDGARFQVVADGDSLSLGDKTLTFLSTPWVHWPETISTYLAEDKVLFSCDFFGSHLATSDLFADERDVLDGAKRYYAEIMMPFAPQVMKNVEKVTQYQIAFIAPSHGPVYDDPRFIVEAYREWTSPKLRNEVCLPYVSMHGSTKLMVHHLVDALVKRGVKVHAFELTVADIGDLAMSLVDAATLIAATPTVHVGAHPAIYYASYIANMVRPKLKYAAVIGSYGWGSKAVDQIAALIPDLRVELLEPVLARGYPTEDDLAALDRLADAIAARHGEL